MNVTVKYFNGSEEAIECDSIQETSQFIILKSNNVTVEKLHKSAIKEMKVEVI